MSDKDDGGGEEGYGDEGAAEETAAETDDVGDAVDGIATFEEISNQEGEGGGAEGKGAGIEDKPEAVEREHDGADDNEADEDIDEPEAKGEEGVRGKEDAVDAARVEAAHGNAAGDFLFAEAEHDGRDDVDTTDEERVVHEAVVEGGAVKAAGVAGGGELNFGLDGEGGFEVFDERGFVDDWSGCRATRRRGNGGGGIR